MKIKIETDLKKIPILSYGVWIYEEINPLFMYQPDDFTPYFNTFNPENEKKTGNCKEIIINTLKNSQIFSGWIVSSKTVKYYSMSEKMKIIAANAYDKCKGTKNTSLVFYLDGDNGAKYAADIAEGIILGSYKFIKYKSQPDEKKEIEIILYTPNGNTAEIKDAVKQREIIAESVNKAREIINDTSRVVTPIFLANTAKDIAKKYNLKCEIYDEKKLAKEGYSGLLAVGRGSSHPPRMIILTYEPKNIKTKDNLFIVGKGLTFDSGGLSIKPSNDMWLMKADMTGSADVLYAMEAIAKLKPKVKVTGVLCAAENAIGPDATYPNEVMKAKNGKYIHITCTDAEGRLALSDGFGYAESKKATHIIDVATLTGSIVIALGNGIDGIFGNDEELINEFVEAGKKVGEIHHPMPLIDEYIEYLKDDVADLNNLPTSRKGGAISAALFLQEFIPKNVKWIHLDIAGVDMTEKRWKYYNPGSTAIPLRSLVEFIIGREK